MRPTVMRFGVVVIFLPVSLLVGCSSQTPANGTITGHLRQVGGAPPGVNRPVPGTVTITGGTVTKDLQVGQDGSYTVEVPPGTYSVVGHSPTAMSGNEQIDCHAVGGTEVKSGATTIADAICSIR